MRIYQISNFHNYNLTKTYSDNGNNYKSKRIYIIVKNYL